MGPKRLEIKKLNDFQSIANNDINCDITSSSDEEARCAANMRTEENILVLVQDSKANNKPLRLDFSQLKPEMNPEGDKEILRQVRIRSGSFNDKLGVNILLATNQMSYPPESPSVLVIRSKRHSLD